MTRLDISKTLNIQDLNPVIIIIILSRRKKKEEKETEPTETQTHMGQIRLHNIGPQKTAQLPYPYL